MDARIIGTIGLVFDMIGAIFVAVEVVKIYRGKVTSGVNGIWRDLGKPTTEYKKFEKRKRIWMGVGLLFLLLGFTLQIIAIWIK